MKTESCNLEAAGVVCPAAVLAMDRRKIRIGVARETVTDREESKAQGSGGLSQAYIPSIVERGSERPGGVKGAPLFRRGDSAPFTARTALKSWRREGKDDTPQRSPGGKGCFTFVTEVH
jgi:hypothetical protein